MSNKLSVKCIVKAPIEKIWEFWTGPEHIIKWAFASDDWKAPHAENDVRVGGRFKTVMSAKRPSSAEASEGHDKSTSFDFTGTYTAVQEHKLIEYNIDGNDGLGGTGRHVKIKFDKIPEGVQISETFDPENENPLDMQRSGWQAILKNFKKYVELN